MLTRNRGNNQELCQFDAIQFELECEAKFVKSENQYRKTNYEIDSDPYQSESIYRVWDGVLLIGRFFWDGQWWRGEPYYSNRTYIRSLKSLFRVFNSNTKAINYIIRSDEDVTSISFGSSIAIDG